MSDFHGDFGGDHYDLGGSHHDAGSHHMGGHYGGDSHSGAAHGQGLMGSIGHFLGMDSCSNDSGHHDMGHAGSTDPGHVQTTDSLSGSRWGQFFSGLSVTPTMLLATLFGGMTLWLGVVYFVSHNGAPHSDTPKRSVCQQDQQLMAGMRGAMPIQHIDPTPVYNPNGAANVGATVQAPVQDPATFTAAGAIQAAPLVNVSAAPGQVAQPAYQAPYPIACAAPGSPRSYNVHVQTAEGMRLRTIVNR